MKIKDIIFEYSYPIKDSQQIFELLIETIRSDIKNPFPNFEVEKKDRNSSVLIIDFSEEINAEVKISIIPNITFTPLLTIYVSSKTQRIRDKRYSIEPDENLEISDEQIYKIANRIIGEVFFPIQEILTKEKSEVPQNLFKEILTEFENRNPPIYVIGIKKIRDIISPNLPPKYFAEISVDNLRYTFELNYFYKEEQETEKDSVSLKLELLSGLRWAKMEQFLPLTNAKEIVEWVIKTIKEKKS